MPYKDPVRQRKAVAEWGQRPETREYQKVWYQKNRDRVYGTLLQRRYGITLEDYQNLLTKQGGKCAICDRSPGKRQLAVDHCHKTGTVRGLLCSGCNRGIGFFCDNPDSLAKAIEYLRAD